jgi:hypothetical protein
MDPHLPPLVHLPVHRAIWEGNQVRMGQLGVLDRNRIFAAPREPGIKATSPSTTVWMALAGLS